VDARKVLGIIAAGGVVAWVIYQLQARGTTDSAVDSSAAGLAQSGVEDVQAAIAGWQTVGEGPTWVPVLNQAEQQLGIPTNLLARVAYQESHFRADIITGETVSPAGALGLMQLEPAYFSTVQVAVPFQASDTEAQITQAGQDLLQQYNQFHDWGLALAAYNDGGGNISAYLAGTHTLPAETTTYVAEILTDVPLPTSLQT
jgi:membrane-bound lytic murein transglycosylase MltF